LFVIPIARELSGDRGPVVKRGKKGNGRRAFLALRAEIKRELDAGAFAKTVHARFEERLGIGYRQFAKYVKRYELLASDQALAQPAAILPRAARAPNQPLPLSSAAEPTAPREPLNARRPPPKRFIFDPTDIDLKKLI
jgi:hypothetical protein